MNRTIGALALVVLTTPAVAAAGWSSYLNARFGYEMAVPPGYVGQGEPDAHDGQVFAGPHGQSLRVWGGYLVVSNFAGDLSGSAANLKQRGWTLTYQATTPRWGSFSGTKGVRVIYAREISGCKGDRTASFELEYSATEINAMKPVIERLVGGLKQADCPF